MLWFETYASRVARVLALVPPRFSCRSIAWRGRIRRDRKPQRRRDCSPRTP